MAELKTRPTRASVQAFLAKAARGERGADCRRLVQLMKQLTGKAPRLWGTSIVGFGTYHYISPVGTEGDWFQLGFSPRKSDLTLYVMSGFEGMAPLLKRLGPHRLGKCCLYIKGLDQVNQAVLRQLLRRSLNRLRATYDCW